MISKKASKPRVRVIQICAPRFVETDSANFRFVVQKYTGNNTYNTNATNHLEPPTTPKGPTSMHPDCHPTSPNLISPPPCSSSSNNNNNNINTIITASSSPSNYNPFPMQQHGLTSSTTTTTRVSSLSSLTSSPTSSSSSSSSFLEDGTLLLNHLTTTATTTNNNIATATASLPSLPSTCIANANATANQLLQIDGMPDPSDFFSNNAPELNFPLIATHEDDDISFEFYASFGTLDCSVDYVDINQS